MDSRMKLIPFKIRTPVGTMWDSTLYPGAKGASAIDEVGTPYIAYWVPCGPLPVGEFIKGMVTGEIKRIRGINHKCISVDEMEKQPCHSL